MNWKDLLVINILKIKNLFKFYIIVSLVLVLSSCTPLGSKTKIYKSKSLTELERVGVITKAMPIDHSKTVIIIKEAFTRTLLKELNEQEIFNFIFIDTSFNETLQIENLPKNNDLDAILVAEWFIGMQLESEALVLLTLYEPPTMDPIIRSSVNTTYGKNYWTIPNQPATLIKATEEAVRLLTKKIKKLKK